MARAKKLKHAKMWYQLSSQVTDHLQQLVSDKKPRYSLVGEAHHCEMYESFYNNIDHNNIVPFEVVFVGNSPPTKQMPDNFNYIVSQSGLPECLQIAIDNAKGEILLPTSDSVRYSDRFLYMLEYYAMKLNMEKVFISFKSGHDEREVNFESLVFDIDIPNAPIIGVWGMFKKDIWDSLGKINQCFSSELCVKDMQMRYLETGLTIFIPPEIYLYDLQDKDVLNEDKELLLSLWKEKIKSS